MAARITRTLSDSLPQGTCRVNSRVQVGSKVKRTYENGDGATETEVGVVVHIWRDSETGLDDAYIAFLGKNFPDGKPDVEPCILRYFLSGLELVD